MDSKKEISIIGAGLVGSLMAIYLVKRGYRVNVYEGRDDLRQSTIDGGRSINLALSNRGWLPLEEVGIIEKVKPMVIPMHGRMMHDKKSELTFQPYGKQDQFINSVSRGGLNAILLDEAEKLGAKFHFKAKCSRVNFANNTFSLLKEGVKSEVKSDIIIGADGAFSAIRRSMQHTSRFNYSQFYLDYGYKELTIPPADNGSFAIEKNALHIWPRGNFMLIALPNLDGSFTVTLFFPFEGKDSFESLNSNSAIEQFFKTQFPDACELMPSLIDDFNTNPTSDLVTVKASPWFKNRTLLIGDAAHAIVPFYGQGMNCGFEDCRILNELLDKHNDDWEKVLPEYSEARKKDADAISDLALKNFIEMRDLVADKKFLTRKKIEAKLHEKYPEKWIPLYTMVTFMEHMRYSEALEKGDRQNEIMNGVMGSISEDSQLDDLNLETIISKL